MRIGMSLNYAGGFAETVEELADYEKAGPGHRVRARGLQLRRGQPARLHRRQDRAAADRLGHPPAVLADARADRDDRGRARLRLRRPVHPRHRGLRAAGDRGLARRALRRAGRPDPGDHRDLPDGVAAASGWSTPGRHYTIPLPPGPGHRARQAAQADQPPGPRPDPDHPGRARARRTSSWPPSWPRAGSRSSTSRRRRPWSGAARWRPGRAKRDPALPPLDVVAQAALAIGDDVAGLPGPGPAVLALYIGGMGRTATRAATSTTSWRSGTATGTRRPRSRTPTWTAARTRPPRWCRPSCWRGPR